MTKRFVLRGNASTRRIIGDGPGWVFFFSTMRQIRPTST
jgi:hypothetical protein